MANSDKHVYNEAEIRELIRILQVSARELRETGSQMQTMSRLISDGALMGQGGDALSQGLTGSLNPAIERLAQKLEERARFVSKELEEHLRETRNL